MKLSIDARLILVTRLVALLAIGAAMGAFSARWAERPAKPTAVAIGRAYSSVIVGSYSAAWSTAADDVEAGKPIAEAIARIRPASDAARVKAFEADVAPFFAAIVPDGTADKDVTADRRAALAKAFRDFARGLGP